MNVSLSTNVLGGDLNEAICSFLGGGNTATRLMSAMAICPQWQEYKGLQEADLTVEGWKNRLARLEKELSIEKMAKEENTQPWQIIKREKPGLKSWKQHKLEE